MSTSSTVTSEVFLMTDDGQDAADNPFACSGCGCAISEHNRIRGPGYCDACLRDMGFAVEGDR